MDQLSMFEKPRLTEFDKPTRSGSSTTTSSVTSSSNSKPIGLSTEEMDLILQIAERHGKAIGGGKNQSARKSSNSLFAPHSPVSRLHSSAPNLNYDPNEDDGDGDSNDGQKFSSEDFQKPFSIEEELCSERRFMNRSKARSKSISYAPSSSSNQDARSILDGVNRPRRRSQSILGSTGQRWEKSSLNASAPNLSFDPLAVDSDEEEEDMDAMLQAAKAMHKPRSKSLVEVSRPNKQDDTKQRSKSLVVKKSLSDHVSKTPGKKKKKKRIIVRASELGITCPPSDALSLDGNIDSKEVEEAVKRWSSTLKDVRPRRKSVDGSTSSDGSMTPHCPEKRRNALRPSERRRSNSCHRSKSRPRSSVDDTKATKERSSRTATPSRTRSKSIDRSVSGRSRSLPNVNNVASPRPEKLESCRLKEKKKDDGNDGLVVKSRQSSKAESSLETGVSAECLERAVSRTKPDSSSRTRSKATGSSAKKRSHSLPRVKNVAASPSDEFRNARSKAEEDDGDIEFVVKSRLSSKEGSYLEKDAQDESQVRPPLTSTLQKTPVRRAPSAGRRGLQRSKSADLSTPTRRASKVANDSDVLRLGIISQVQLQELKKAGFYIAKS